MRKNIKNKKRLRYRISDIGYQNFNGFTLIELLIVIAIIGILAGVVLVSSQSGVGKAKRASAITTASSAMTELTVCADDGGFVKNGDITAGDGICCTAAANATCTTAGSTLVGGHTVNWPSLASVGWQYRIGGKSGTLADNDLEFIIENIAGTESITCSFNDGSCS